MKYIRTKDGRILEVKNETAIHTPNIVSFPNENRVVKEADTIEELCDRFFLVDTRNKLIQETVSTSLVLRTWQALVGEQPENVLLIFGIIVVSKGLIYVSQYDKNKKEMVLL